MNCLIHPSIHFHYAGLFQREDTWIHPARIETTFEIIYMVRGEIFLNEGNQSHHLREGQLLLLEPNVLHKGSAHTANVSFYWLHFSLAPGVTLPFSTRLFERFENVSLLKELLHCHNLPAVPDYLVNSILLHILSELCRLSAEHEPRLNASAEKIYEWIRINADATLSVERAAKRFGYSSDHLSRICKKSFGVGACTLINRFLCEKAKNLLCNTEKYVKEIAADLKFPSDKAFIAFFRYHEGCFPTEFRNRFGKIHMNNH
ncbi:MAG: helix-turn-helix transcriptional regulator [Clostridia bacterium]|nr:helix-turn-helix transcriptional regulator [Clostridia bacterium]